MNFLNFFFFSDNFLDIFYLNTENIDYNKNELNFFQMKSIQFLVFKIWSLFLIEWMNWYLIVNLKLNEQIYLQHKILFFSSNFSIDIKINNSNKKKSNECISKMFNVERTSTCSNWKEMISFFYLKWIDEYFFDNKFLIHF